MDEKQKEENLKNLINGEWEKGNIVVATFEGLQCMPLEDFLNQPADGISYDLNRSEEIVWTFINDPKWVNDFAVAKTIRTLKERLDKANEKA